MVRCCVDSSRFLGIQFALSCLLFGVTRGTVACDTLHGGMSIGCAVVVFQFLDVCVHDWLVQE